MELDKTFYIFLMLCITFENSILFGAAQTSFDPFMDSNLFLIKWAGPLDLNNEEVKNLGDRHMMITTNHQEQYRCILPETKTEKEGDAASYTGPSPDELLDQLMTAKHCSYRIESYWTYELCHGKHLKQYHEMKDPSTKTSTVQEYQLGFGNHRAKWKEANELEKLNIPDGPLPVRDLEGVELPYFEVIMDGGTNCDLTNTPRKAHVLYVCHAEGRGEVYELKESSTCEYEVVVLTAQLCKHPKFRPKTPPVNEIRCHAMGGSPIKPTEMTRNELETSHLQHMNDPGAAHLIPEPHEPQLIRKSPSTQEPQAPAQNTQQTNRISQVTDQQTLRSFFSGSQCMTGGSGWWKHELCFGKFVKQFHMEKGIETKIILGWWSKEKHLEWLENNPLKKPKEPQERKMVSLFYGGGDICDLTKKPRTTEVRLKCLPNIKNQHAMLISLQEPVACQYVLTVESALMCTVLKDADENGLFDNIEL